MCTFHNNIVFYIFLLFSFFNPYALFAVRQVDPYLTEGEKKKLEKADGYNNEANKKIEEANALYLQISELQAMGSTDEKKISKLEEKAVNLQVEALELNQQANKVRYDVYRDKVDKFLKEYEGNETSLVYPKLLEEQANEEFYKANQLKSDASGSNNGFEKYLKLLEAQEAELKGLEHEEKAIEAYMNVSTIAAITYEEPVATTKEPIATTEEPVSTGFQTPVKTQPETYTYTPGPDTPKSNIVFDDYQIEIIRKLQNNEIPAGNNYFNLQAWDINTLEGAWDDYRNNVPPEKTPADFTDVGISESDSTPVYADVQDQTQTYDYTDKTPDTQQPYNTDTYKAPDQTTYIPATDKTKTPTETHDAYTRDVNPADIYSGSGVIYRVQIAADKQPLSQSTLKRIYYGQHTVEMISEKGWYKYSIGDFGSYGDANAFRNGCGVQDAFIVAYKGGQKVNMAEVRDVDRSSAYAPAGQIIFKVQIAAFKSPLSNENLSSLYNGSERVDMTQEAGWYKYSIGELTSYEQAASLKSQSGVSDAFIVAYMNGQKLDLYLAMNKPGVDVQRYAEISSSTDVIFGVQIAASRAPITMDNLSLLYKGNKSIIESTSGGWFRYRIDLGKSYEDAKKFKDSCGVKGAFIVAHQNGERVRVKDATNQKK